MVTYAIRGMTCQHCVRAVERALSKVPGVDRVSVDLARGVASIDGAPSPEAVVKAVRDEGYDATL